MRLGTGCTGAGAGVKSTIWWGKRLAPPSYLSSMALQLSWPFSPFRAHSSLSFIPLSHPLGPFPLPCSALTSASRKLLAASDPSLLAELRRMRIRPHPFWAAISSSNTSPRPNWAFFPVYFNRSSQVSQLIHHWFSTNLDLPQQPVKNTNWPSSLSFFYRSTI